MGPSKVTFTYPGGLAPVLRPAFDQYLAFLVGVMADGLDPNPERPEINATSAGEVNTNWKERSQQARTMGTRGSGSLVSYPSLVESRSASSLQLEDCSLDQGTTFDAKGSIISEPSTNYVKVIARLVLSDDAKWRVDVFYATGQSCSHA